MMSHACQASVTSCAKIPFQSTGYQVLKIFQINSLGKFKYNASGNDNASVDGPATPPVTGDVFEDYCRLIN